ncbi:MAG: ComEC/Rec2 family competence protein [Dysgonamonadaceae bacterium]|jgi:competence protein ComEC|nr:ComEC/Rec2 family competence protein [Dysgonamonadaceae bacterium]
MLHQIPFLRLLLFFIAGVIAQWCLHIPVAGICILSLITILSLGLSFVPKIKRQYRFRFLFGTGLSCLLFTAAVFITKATQKQSEWNVPAENYWYQAIIIDEPIAKPKTRMCKIRITAAEEAIHPAATGKKAVIYLPKDSLSQTLVAGDGLLFYGQLESALPYLKKQSTAASGFIRKNRWTVQNDVVSAFSIRLKALSIRRMLLHRLQQMIPDLPAYSIAAALMFGYYNEVDDILMQSFRNIGAAHILAISGTHFAILFGMCYFSLSLIISNSQNGKRLKQGILLPLAWAFAFLTGFSPSVVRAVLMLSIWGVGEILAYRAFTLNTVAATAFLMLLFNPLYLFNVGCQLSFMAVISIILVNPYLVKLYKSRNPVLRYLWELISVSISAQIGVLPLSVYYFHQFPVIFLLTNICLLPLASVLLYLIPTSLLLHYLCSGAQGLWYPLNRVLDIFISIVQHLDRFSYSNINHLYMNEWDTLVLALAMVLFVLLWIKKRGIYLCLLLILVVFHVMYRFL